VVVTKTIRVPTRSQHNRHTTRTNRRRTTSQCKKRRSNSRFPRSEKGVRHSLARRTNLQATPKRNPRKNAALHQRLPQRTNFCGQSPRDKIQTLHTNSRRTARLNPKHAALQHLRRRSHLNPKISHLKCIICRRYHSLDKMQISKTRNPKYEQSTRRSNQLGDKVETHNQRNQSKYIILTRRRRIPDWTQSPMLNKRPLPIAENPRILGITLDAKLTWTKHINTIQQSANRKLNILKSFAGKTFTRRSNLRTLYLGFVRPTLEYASVCWTSAANYKLAKLERIQNSALRLITGAARSTPIEVLQADTNIPPLRKRWEQDLLRTVFRNQRKDSTTTSRKLIQKARNGPAESPLTRAGNLIQRLFQTPIPHCAGTPPPVPPQPPTINAEQTPTKPFIILFREAKKRLTREWHSDYETTQKGEHYRSLRPTIQPLWPHTNLRTYRLSATIFRIRGGHNNLGAQTKANKPKDCDFRKTEDSTEHLLFNCKKFEEKRKQLFNEIKSETKQKIPITKELLLGRPKNKNLANELLTRIATRVAKFALQSRPDL